MIDTHAHLDACSDAPEIVLERARASGVERILAVGTDIASCRTALTLAEREEGVWAILGIHPHQAGGAEADRIDELEELLRHPKVVAVGETGLDHFRDYAPHDAQARLFRRHLDLASRLELPVVIHTRAADDETVAELATFGGTIVLHCFSSPALLKFAIERRCYCSFAGNVTYPKAADLRGAAAALPLDRLLTETDCPYLAPQPVRGQTNEPAFVSHVADTLAEVRGIRFAYARQSMVEQLAAFDVPMKSRSGLSDELDRYDVVRARDVPVWDMTLETLPPVEGNDAPRGIAEIVMVPVIPATLNAIHDATGKRFTRLPVTPDDILKAP